jgi:hypothetical protein
MARLPDADQTGARARARAAAMACSSGSAPPVAMLHTELTTRGWRPSQRTMRRTLQRLGGARQQLDIPVRQEHVAFIVTLRQH